MMDKKKDFTQQIGEIVSARINAMEQEVRDAIRNALCVLLGDRAEKYALHAEGNITLTNAELQARLSRINEKTENRKNKGVYYTPEDVCKYIVWNSILMMTDVDNDRTYRERAAIARVLQFPQNAIGSLIFRKTFFDPTCGSGEFLLNALKAKLTLLEQGGNGYSDLDLYNIAKTLYGNDIDANSTDISKIRLFFEIVPYIKSVKYYDLIAKEISARFCNRDYVIYDGQFNDRFDCIVGNPPYVEYGKFEDKEKLQNDYGNIYADVIKNSVLSLKKGGAFGFILPLSYISTSRMAKIRNYVTENTNTQFILSFADRPDCLFQGVHQKLNIVFARKGRQEHKLFTSNYKHFYKEERKDLLNGCAIKENHHAIHAFIPKIGNDLEENIYRKTATCTNDNLFEKQIKTGKPVYLNMRGCFWIKAFSFHPGSKEYKAFSYDKNFSFVHCVLNSGLFWLYWTIVSDCWHITTKELKGFYLPDLTDGEYKAFDSLSARLEKQLESTKKYIGSKQVDYEYKHKECKREIDEIDDLLAEIYELTDEELAYVKNFALKYRTGSGADDQNN